MLRSNPGVFGGFLLFFLIFFIPYPLQQQIIGSCDNLLIIFSLSKTYLNQLLHFFTGQFVGQAMFPANVIHFGETSLGCSLIFLIFKLPGLSDVWAFYFYIVTVFTLMSFSLYLLAGLYLKNTGAALFSTVIFIFSAFLWGNIDDLYAHFYFLPFLSAYWLKRGLEENQPRYLQWMAVSGGLQIYFTPYVFIYQTLMLVVIALMNYRELLKKYSPSILLRTGMIYGGLTLPFLTFYVPTVLNREYVDAWVAPYAYRLQILDFVRALPQRLIHYPFTVPAYGQIDWVTIRHHAFIGLAAPLLAGLALIKPDRQKTELLVIALLGVLFSMGAVIQIQMGGHEYFSPLKIFYEHFPFFKFLRVALRSYELVVFSVAILAGMGLLQLIDAVKKYSRAPLLPGILTVGMLFWVLAENISIPINPFETIPYPHAPKDYVEFFKDKPQALILDLPSHSVAFPEYINEILYMLWQTQHHRNILGGVNGYYPPSRIAVQKHSDLLPQAQAFEFFKKQGLTHLVIHHSPFLYHRRQERFEWAEHSPRLKRVFDNSEIKIYELR